MAEPTPTQPPARRERPRAVAAAILGGAAAVFAVLNLDDVEVNWIVGTFTTPLIIVIAVCLLIGGGIGWAAGRRRDRKG
jgi:uncharacterized integral membrane protein